MKSLIGFTAMTLSLTFFATSSVAQQFTLCKGQYFEMGKGKCEQYDVFADCGKGSEVAEATKRCRAFGASGTPNLVVMKSVGGHNCGYAMMRVTCQ
jgi:hypothetical protein